MAELRETWKAKKKVGPMVCWKAESKGDSKVGKMVAQWAAKKEIKLAVQKAG
jgi:ribosomal protein L35AE/L33A